MNKFLLGVIAGLLIAPKSGKELRGDICDRTQDILDDIKKLDKEKAKDGLENFKIKVVSMDVNTAKDAINTASEKTKDVLNDAVDAIQQNETLRTLPNKSVDALSGAALKTVDFIDEQDIVNKGKDFSKKTAQVANDTSKVVVKQAKEVTEKTVQVAQKVADQTVEVYNKVADSVEDITEKTKDKVKGKFDKK